MSRRIIGKDFSPPKAKTITRKMLFAEVLLLVFLLVAFSPLLSGKNSFAEQYKKPLTAASDVVTATNIVTISESLDAEKIVKSIKENVKTDLLSELQDLEKRILQNGITYSWNHPAGSYEKALSGNHKVNCAAYVSWALQEMGYLPEGRNFYISDTLHGKAKSDLKNLEAEGKLTIKYNVGRVKDTDLKPGDIVGWKTHTCVYAGKDENGNRLWYTAGGKDVSSKNLGPKTKGYSNKYITVLIRVNS